MNGHYISFCQVVSNKGCLVVHAMAALECMPYHCLEFEQIAQQKLLSTSAYVPPQLFIQRLKA